MMGLSGLLVAMALSFTTPTCEVAVEKNVPYATAMGYYTHAPIGEKGSTFKLLFHSGIPKPVTLEMDIYKPVTADPSLSATRRSPGRPAGASTSLHSGMLPSPSTTGLVSTL